MARKIKLSENQLTQIIEKVMRERNITLKEDSEGEETYHYGEDEGRDRKEEMSMEDRVKAIEDHLHHLKKDMGYDEDHEDRDERGTDFRESRRKRKTIKEDFAGTSVDMSKLVSCVGKHMEMEEANIPKDCIELAMASLTMNIMLAAAKLPACVSAIQGRESDVSDVMQKVVLCYTGNPAGIAN